MSILKKHFSKLFEYDCESNEKFIHLLNKPDAPPQAIKLMAHLLMTQHTWLNRCKGLENPPDLQVWPGWKPVVFMPTLTQNHDDWTVFLANVKDDEWLRIINYKTTQGVPHADPLMDIVTHVINHGTHHRAQIGQLLKAQTGMQLPVTDYIAFIRQ
ncbi:DinB family protein [Mucilaginibacter defluvii]|uniref:Damage-inducible protein DinB n=1 Tax=Mucilaginibacter defluvii TaxID=1196019 RepID=A0ABP9FSA9_9SPHI